jgi:YidC/Oxa1 family membrane protein insertase
MMTYMTVFMGVMFYKVPAGLCLYFITSSLWGICERKLLPKPPPKANGGVDVAKPASTPPGINGSSGGKSSKKQKKR